MTIEQLFGTLQQSVVSTWRKHLRTAKYSKHMALNDFYEEMPEKVDALIEAWMGVNSKKIKNYENILQSSNMNTLSYLKELRRVVKQGYVLMNGEKELEALLDDIVELIDSTLYKVKELNENNMIDLKDFINESLINESNNDFKSIDLLYKEDGDLISISTCFNWLEELDWEKMSEEEYAEAIHDINDDIEEDVFFSKYCECIMAMAKLGRKQTLKYIKKISSKEEMEDFGINE
jgi:DNA-binding ferritin-like protein